MLRLFYFGKAAASLDYSDNKKQNEQGVSDSLQCSVNRQDYLPYCAALEGLGRLGEQSPYFRKLSVPGIKCVL